MLRQVVITVLVVVVAVFLAMVYDRRTSYTTAPPKMPVLWWGAGKEHKVDATVHPFKISVPTETLQDLGRRLNSTQPFHPPLDGVDFQYGFNTNYLRTVVDFWKTKYSWPTRQNLLNSLPQFTTEVAGLKIHMIHVKPSKTDGLTVLPLLVLHGWPGSLKEFYNFIPLLTTPRPGEKFVFEVIAPALPGYGFSQATNKPGLGAAQVAVIFNTLMEQLGFKKYYIQGGDWGAVIGTNMAQLYPERVKGLHANMCFAQLTLMNYVKLLIGSYFPTLICEEDEIDKTYPFMNMYLMILEESGYMHLQATKPDTIGVALRDSPAGLAAYILEKFSSWTNMEWKKLPDGGLPIKYDMTDLLDNVMIYWVTGSITSSMRLYSETFNKKQFSLGLDYVPVTVPSACARFPHEIAFLPKSFISQKYKKLVSVTDFEDGGHFAAFEKPQELANDVWKAVKLMIQDTEQKKNQI